MAWLEDKKNCKYPNFNDDAKSKKKILKKSLSKSGERMIASFTDTEFAKCIINHTNPKQILRIYDGQFRLQEEIIPKVSASTEKRQKKAPMRVLEMQRSQNHWRPLIRWDGMDAQLAQRIQDGVANGGCEKELPTEVHERAAHAPHRPQAVQAARDAGCRHR